MQFLEQFFQVISKQAIPSACLVCERYQLNNLCINCLNSFAANALFNYECCSQCGIALEASELLKQKCGACINQPPYFDKTYCLDRYEGALQHALHLLKYQKRTAYAHGLANIWNQFISNKYQTISAGFLFPVPMSMQKLAMRGFNQSWEIARRIECNPNIVKSPFALMRHHRASHQAGKNLFNRIQEIENVFYLDSRFTERLKGETVIIFDDVMTTGATLNEIARLLKENGVYQVINWVLLRTSRALHV
jgi:ComF family protein